MDVINDVVLILDPGSSRIIDVNRCAAKIYGYTKKELVGKKLELLTHEPTDFSHALHSRRAFERTDINKQGQTIEFLVTFSLIDYWGRRAILSINRDISERKRIEAAIAASEKRARLLIQGISEIIALLDEDGTVRFISPQAQRTLGLDPSEVKGSTVFDFLHPQDRERATAEFAKTISEPGEAVPSMVRLRNREGQWVPFEVIANNQLRDPDVKGIIFTARDLRFRLEAEQSVRRANADFDRQVEQRTMDLAKANAALRIENQERRYAQTQLEHSVSLLNSTLESTVDGILVISNGGRISSCNQKFLDMWHIPRIAVAGLRNEDLLASVAPQLEMPGEFLDDLETMQAKSDTVGFKLLTLKDGRIFERYSQPQRVDGTIVGRVWSFRDVTQARRLEDELRQAQKMEAVGRLAGGVAHEFNNVLMIISGYADQLLHDPELPESDRAYCEQLIEATRRATVLVRQLLAFSRKHPIRPQTIDLNAIVKDISKMLQPLLSTRIQLVVVCPDKKLMVNADPSQLELMIMNLVINARDAMPDGGILSLMTSSETLREEVTLPEAPKDYVVLQINDTGIGMPPEIKQRIFEPFFSTKDVGKGTGLGLSMVYGIVEQADGHITVESEPNNGTTFRIYLPLSHRQPTERPEEAKTLPSKGTATLLLVEDEVGIRLMTRKYLESLEYTVLEADTGEQAWTIFNEHKDEIQLLITDMIMPGIRGDELVRRIREERPYMPAIYISGYVDTFELDTETSFLEKPFSFPELGRRVEASLAGAKQTGTLAESAAAEPPRNA
jgi:PAS domain S-box-containing protein